MDIENLMGGPWSGESALGAAVEGYKLAAGIRPHDHTIIACNPALVIAVYCAWGDGPRIDFSPGRDGADKALLRASSNVEWLAPRYDRVVIGSGDAIFTSTAKSLRKHGLPVGVVSLAEALSHLLAESADFIRYLPDVEGRAA